METSLDVLSQAQALLKDAASSFKLFSAVRNIVLREEVSRGLMWGSSRLSIQAQRIEWAGYRPLHLCIHFPTYLIGGTGMSESIPPHSS